MLENPIQQPEVTDGFGVSEEVIKQLNPNYSKNVNTNTQPTIIREEVNTTNINEGQIRKIIAEELTKVLPSIVEKYFDAIPNSTQVDSPSLDFTVDHNYEEKTYILIQVSKILSWFILLLNSILLVHDQR